MEIIKLKTDVLTEKSVDGILQNSPIWEEQAGLGLYKNIGLQAVRSYRHKFTYNYK